jgi:hypothetical protein
MLSGKHGGGMTAAEEARLNDMLEGVVKYAGAPAALGSAVDGLVFLLDTLLTEVRELRAEVGALSA